MIVRPTRRYEVIVVKERDQYVSYVPDLNFISTQADTEEELMKRTKEMIEGFLQTLMKTKQFWPLPALQQ